MEEIEKLVGKLEDNIRWWKRAFETDGFESNEEGSYRRELENTKKELYTSIQQELDRVREEVEKKFREKCKKREGEMNVPYSEEDGNEFWQGYQEGYRQGLHDMIIDTFYLDKEFQSKLTTK